MHTLVKKSLSLFFALTLLFSPLAAPYLAPKAEAQLGGAVASCLTGFIMSYVSSLIPGLEVYTKDNAALIKECMDSIAFALAKTLLAKMTDSIINWINSGFDGNPFYIGDTGSFFKNVIRDELQLALDDLKNTQTIYFDIIRQEAIYKARLTLGDRLGYTLDSAIVTGLCGYAQYENYEFCSQQLTPESRSELARAFTRGYIPFQWSTWDSLTQNCGNNIFCANTSALNYQLAQRQERLQQLNNDLNRSGGFLNQEVCADPGFERDRNTWDAEAASYTTPPDDDFVGPPEPPESALANEIASGAFRPRPVCQEWIIKTPGRTIADKLTSNLGTTERQLELADELNESIAAIFDALISKLISDGLSSFKGGNNNGNSDDDAYYRSLYSDNNGFEYEPTNDVLNRDQEACEITGGTFDSELEVCNFEEEDTNTSGGFPQFPWTLDDGTIIENDQAFAVYVNAHLGQCIQIDELRVVEGTEPCNTGVSSNAGDTGGVSAGTLSITPEPLLKGSSASFSISTGPSNVNYEITLQVPSQLEGIFLGAGVTDEGGAGTISAQIPTVSDTEGVVTVQFGSGESLEKVVSLTQ